MPVPLGPIIIAAGSLLSGILGASAVGGQNRRSQRFADRTYERQKADNLAFWQQQNEYNAPQAQVDRLKQAGLSPALLYGGSAAGAAGQADNIRTPEYKNPEFRPADFNFVGEGAASSISAIYDLEIKDAQIDNLRAQNTVALEEAALKAAQRRSTDQSISRSEFDLELDKELRETSAEYRKEMLRKLQADRAFTLDENERKAAQNSQSLQEGLERILSMRVERVRTKADTARLYDVIKGIRKDNTIKDLDIELRKAGINPNDPLWARLLARLALSLTEKAGIKMPDIFDTSGSSFKGKTPLGLPKYNW